MLQLETTTPGTYADVVLVIRVGAPKPTVPAVKTTSLASISQEYRPGRIPDNGECVFGIQYDPNDTTHQALYTALYAGSIKNWKLVYFDDKTTHANVKFSGFITAIEETDKEAETDNNVEANVTLQVTGTPVRTAGTP